MTGMAVGNLKNTNDQVLIKFQQNCLKQKVGQFVLRSIKLLILFGIRRNCLSSGRNWSLYLFMRRVMKRAVVIIEAYHFYQRDKKCYPKCSVKVNSICR